MREGDHNQPIITEIHTFTTIVNSSFLQKLLQEIEKNKDKVDECQTYAKSYIDAVKVSELLTCTETVHSAVNLHRLMCWVIL